MGKDEQVRDVTCKIPAKYYVYVVRTNVTRDGESMFRAVARTKHRQRLSNINEPISYQTLRKATLELVHKAGLDPTILGTHSMRSGGATAATNNGVSDRLFKRHGRSRSDRAKDGYVKYDLEARLSVSRSPGLG